MSARSDVAALPEAVATARAWVLDVDGCLMRTRRAGGSAGEAMPGAADLIRYLRKRGDAVVVCTNASQKPPAEYAAHLRRQGLDVPNADFVTAGSAAADYIAAHHPGGRVLVVGDDGLRVPLRDLGVELADPDDDDRLADVVVVGAADAYTTPVINAACLAVDAGAPLYCTVDAPWFHGGIGKSVAVSAAITSAIAWTTGVESTVLGKPSPALGETLLRRVGADAAAVTVVGDAPAENTLARDMGANSVLVLSGATSAEAAERLTGPARPDVVTADVAALLEALTTHRTPSRPAPSHSAPSHSVPGIAGDTSAQGDRP